MDKIKIKELVSYYVNRYDMKTKNMADSYAGAGDGLGTYCQALRRIMINTPIGGQDLWFCCIPKEGGDRRISISDFEKHCFLEWEKYLKDNIEANKHDPVALEKDKEKFIRLYTSEGQLQAMVDENIEHEEQAIIDVAINEADENSGAVFLSAEEIDNKKHLMMLEAIYDIFYEPFNIELLKSDMEKVKSVDSSDLKMTLTGDVIESKKRLSNYKNYISEKRSPHKS